MNNIKTNKIIIIASVAAFIYQMVYTQYLLQGSHRHVITHLGLALLITYLVAFQESETSSRRAINLILCLFSIVVSVYLWINYEALISRVWSPTVYDLIVGVILLIVCFVGCVRYFGPIVPIIAAVFVIYPFFGHYLPEPFFSISYPLSRTINNLTTSLGGGIFDVPIGISARYLFLVVVLGFVLNGLGATKFFVLIAKRYQHRLRSGPGLLAVISSAGVGSVIGSGEANTAITGSFTIPAMKSAGYTPELAAGIEAVSSIGGQILPPIMGFIAFVMVGYTGIPYKTVITMALIPGIIYFLFVGLHVHFAACKQNYEMPEKQELSSSENKELIQSLFLFLVPFSVLIVLIVLGYTVMFTIFWAILSVFVASFIMKETRPSLETIASSLVEGATNGAAIAAMCAIVGLIITSLNMSGMGVKLTSGIDAWTGGSLLLGLLIIMLISIVMGLTGIATASYILVAIFAVPALIRMGVEFEVAHFFAMYPTVFTFITPPVALSVLVASRIAGSNYLKSSVEAVKIATSGFLLPFLFVYAPILLARRPDSLQVGLLDILGSITCLFAIQIANVGYLFANIGYLIRIIYYLSGGLLFSFVITKNIVLLEVGLTLLIVLIVLNYRTSKSAVIINDQALKAG